ncbi:MAG: LamG domain-containing protein [Cyanobacteria bacterium P01_F01_bin.150]
MTKQQILHFNGGCLQQKEDTDAFSFQQGAFTVEAWIKPTEAKGNVNIIGNLNPSTRGGFLVGLNENHLTFKVNLYNKIRLLEATSCPLNLNQWSHIAVCRSSSDFGFSILINGQEKANRSFSTDLTEEESKLISEQLDNTELWDNPFKSIKKKFENIEHKVEHKFGFYSHKPAKLTFGAAPWNLSSLVFKGYISEVRIWNRRLSNDEICDKKTIV